MAEKEKKSDAPGRFSLLGTASVMGMHMVSGPVVGAGLGWLADTWLDSWPVGAAIGLLLGVAAGFRNVWADARYLIRSDSEIDRREAQERSAGKLVSRKPDGGQISVRQGGGQEEPVEKKDDQGAPDVLRASVLAGTADADDLMMESEDEIERALREAMGECIPHAGGPGEEERR